MSASGSQENKFKVTPTNRSVAQKARRRNGARNVSQSVNKNVRTQTTPQMSTSKDQPKTEDAPPTVYQVEYRLSQEEVEANWHLAHNWRRMTADEIQDAIGDDYITHLKCYQVIPQLDTIAPRLEFLLLDDILNRSQLHRLTTLSQLKRLDLANNDFSSGLPSIIGELTSLEKIRLSHCQLQDLPQSMSQLTRLTELNLGRNEFSSGLPDVICKFKTLKSLNLSYCKLSGLSKRLSSLCLLEDLDVSGNDLSSGLPDAIRSLTSLSKIYLNYCQLKDLPPWFGELSQLHAVFLSGNEFVDLPTSIFSLKKLTRLNISEMKTLMSIGDAILNLKELTHVGCQDCSKLVSPPYAVCQQGIVAIQKYFSRLKAGKGIELSVVPVAIVGNALAGKTSVVRSLISEKRVLTNRSTSDTSALDETTKVFEVHDLELPNSTAKLIDHGGHEVYHIAYQYILKERNIAMFVVSLKQFHEISITQGAKEAARETCWNWMSHLYLACPLLGPPLLVLTNTDFLPQEELSEHIKNLLESLEEIRKELLEEESEHCGSQHSKFHNILHLSNPGVPIFHPTEVFLFSSNLQEVSNIKSLKSVLDERCAEFKTVIPTLWKDLTQFVEDQKDLPFLNFNMVKTKFDEEDCCTILKYMHNIGSILWFQQIDTLKDYIFHQTSFITEMISLLFHHRSEEQWAERLARITAFRHKNQMISKAKYKELVTDFVNNGILDEAVLLCLLERESKFPASIALDLLKCFQIVHGPLNRNLRDCYIIPYFMTTSMNQSWMTDGELQHRIEVELGGLPLPLYGYQLATVAFLNIDSRPTTTRKVASDGATVYHGKISSHLIHFCSKKKITIQVSGAAEHLAASWKHLLETTKNLLEYICSIWIACRPSVQVICTHCLYLRDPKPGIFIDPDWFCPISSPSMSGNDVLLDVQQFSGVEPVFCSKQRSINHHLQMPVVPTPLVFPCYKLTNDEIQSVGKYLSKITQYRHLHSATQQVLSKVLPTSQKLEQAAHLQVPSYTSESELSDELGYLDETIEELATIRLRLNPCRKTSVQNLFHSSSVYRMTTPKRGRCLIINNMHFMNYTSSRPGSDRDVDNISKLFKSLEFTWEMIHKDLTAQQMLDVIKKETEHQDHDSYGMFVLVVMTHGSETHLVGSDGNKARRTDILSMLSSQKFQAMAGKPKLIIFQACSGDQFDRENSAAPSNPAYSPGAQPSCSSSSSDFLAPAEDESDASSADLLVADDFFIMTPSFVGHISNRHPVYGSIFIRALVEAFYKHSCHRDVKKLFEEQVTKKVRAKSIAINKQDPSAGRQQPTLICYPTEGRKLYLFPGYNPQS